MLRWARFRKGKGGGLVEINLENYAQRKQEEVKSLMGQADELRRQIEFDANLSAKGKADARRAKVDPLVAQAQEAAGMLMRHVERKAQETDQLEREQVKAWGESINVDRARYELDKAGRKAKSLPWPEIRDEIDRAADLGDREALEAWKTVMPELRQGRRHNSEFLADGSGVPTMARILDGLEALEPPELKAARAAKLDAFRAVQDARDVLGRYDQTAIRRGETPHFAEALNPFELVVTGGPGEDTWAISSRGGGPFG